MSKETHLQADASKSGLGAVLLQDNKPVAYASQSLSETECNYSQIDKELLAVRLLLRLQRYDIAELIYVLGKYLYIADTNSRANIQCVTDDQADLENEVVMVHALEADDDTVNRIKRAKAEDPEIQALRVALQDGWNWSMRNEVPACIQPNWTMRSDIYEHEGLMYVMDRLIIPQPERKALLKRLHMGHLGIQKCPLPVHGDPTLDEADASYTPTETRVPDYHIIKISQRVSPAAQHEPREARATSGVLPVRYKVYHME
ncbi:uncharacterized protein [Watersipora subatra]|uniref:uncharacterized protein n=1 Tax=Watersipora subatra TaxID=2589382 RepID=UPI00355C5AF6